MQRSFARTLALLAFTGLLGGCGSDAPSRVDIYVDDAAADVIREHIAHLTDDRFQVVVSAAPESELDDRLHIAVVSDLSCVDCYRLDQVAGGYVVHGDAPLGVQYGLTHLLELLGYRFFEPWYTEAPAALAASIDPSELGVTHEPDKSIRGLHLHTIHPTEAYYVFWEPGEHVSEAFRVIDWAVKNRANFVEWVALDDIQQPGADASAWRAHTKQIIDYAHRRGVQAGLAIQLFGASNLQQGFDLTDTEDTTAVPEAEIRGRLPVILDGLGVDRINLSFGEFFGTDPQYFIDTLDTAHQLMQEQSPGLDLVTTIHVGGSDDQRVTYMGQDMIYYFLVKFANPEIVPWVHTVMYYNLFEDAGGAYHHDDFSEHRTYLMERLAAGERAGYFPETAYWVAFDISVPTYMPLYVRSRWLDLARIRETALANGHADLDEHTLFSSGWEWGYWQNDYAALRASYELPASYDRLFTDMFSAWGSAGTSVAGAVAELAEIQYRYLMEQRLAAYLAGRDFYIDLGREIDIVSQPDRPLFSEIAAWTAQERAAFVTAVVEPLEAFASEHQRLLGVIQSAGVDGQLRWYREIVDGIAINIARTRFIVAMLRAVIAFADTGADDGWISDGDEQLAAARAIVDRRHTDIVYPNPDQLIYWNGNATLYQWGFLTQTHDLCYWNRERAEATNIIDGVNEVVPNCIF